jgi:hypothetical protein
MRSAAPGSVALFLLLLAHATAQDFTIVALPDTQFYSAKYPEIFKAQTQWIADNVAAKNIKLVLMEGDIVNGGGETYQWQNADAAMKILDGKVPYMVAMGNHDYNQNQPLGRTASATNFNKWFGPIRYTGQSWYQATFTQGSNENYYGFFSFSGRDYIVVVLEAFPRDAVLDWANNVLAAHHGREAILLTHAYLYYDNTRIGRCDGFNAAKIGVTDGNDGEPMWPKLVSKHPNISLVLSGHVTPGDGTGRLSELGVNGNLVNQVVADYQTLANGGNGWLRIMTFHPSSNTIDVKTYSPWLNQYKTDSENQFTLIWHAQGGLPGQPGAISGRVRSATCGDLLGAKITAGGVSTSTNSSGMYTLKLPASDGVQVSVSLNGYSPQSTTMNVPPGFSTEAEFFLNGEAASSGLTGKVSSAVNGSGIAGATVTAGGQSAVTDTSGVYMLPDLAPNTYTVTATKSGWLKNSTTATVVSGSATTANIKLATSGRITGSVKTTTGALVSGAKVSMSGGVIANTTSVLTNSSGVYTSAYIPVGTYNVTAIKTGLPTRSGTATVTAGGKFVLNFTI